MLSKIKIHSKIFWFSRYFQKKIYNLLKSYWPWNGKSVIMISCHSDNATTAQTLKKKDNNDRL